MESELNGWLVAVAVLLVAALLVDSLAYMLRPWMHSRAWRRMRRQHEKTRYVLYYKRRQVDSMASVAVAEIMNGPKREREIKKLQDQNTKLAHALNDAHNRCDRYALLLRIAHNELMELGDIKPNIRPFAIADDIATQLREDGYPGFQPQSAAA